MSDQLPASRRITAALLQNLQGIVEACGATAVFVYADAVRADDLPLPDELRSRVFYISRTFAEQQANEEVGKRCLRVPDVRLSRMGQVKIAVFLAASRGVVHRDDVIVSLTGEPASGTLDTLTITDVGREPEILASMQGEESLPDGVLPEVVERVIDIAAELGSEGREGKPIGALFVVGEAERVLSLSRQLIINPFRGYSDEERNILDPALEETVKELSAIDGAFIVDGNGVIVTCGAFLKTSLHEEPDVSLPRGLGARHHAAAGITAVTKAIAITISESTGSVTVFRNGHIVTEIEKPRSRSRRDG